ncbi:MAG TPA: 2Fe-2S iron-sulfur cluster-binding protein [Planctomycetota bacterium]|nr:2Fe-2S iron-sulfur cluster-binding protein [Planctomycetota bacterium]
MDLVEVQFMPAGRFALVRPGTTLLAAAAAAGVELLSGCTRGMCGTDPVKILAGGGDLEAPAAHEQGTLVRMGLPAGFRLSCSARVIRGLVRVEVGLF